MSFAQEWKKTHHAGTDDSHHRQAIDALASLLENQSSPRVAAETITTTYEDWLATSPASSGRESERNHKISAFWVLYMCDAIRNFGDAVSQQRLVDLLREISQRPDVKRADGSVERGPSGTVYWRDLPHWSYCYAEYGLHYGDPEDWAADEVDDYYAQVTPLLNAARFGATVLARAEVLCDMPAAADRFLQMGIEEPYEETRNITREWQVLLPPAATWLSIAARSFYRLCHGDPGSGEKEVSRRGKWGGRAWCPDRWAFWQERLRTLAARADINEECRGFATEALRRMEEVEAEQRV